jgi:CRP-like cAMP-binding protein
VRAEDEAWGQLWRSPGGAHTCSSNHLAQAATTLDLLRQLIKEGTTERSHLAQAMGVPKYTVSRLAKRAKKAGWLSKVKRKYVIVNAEE